MYMNGYAGKLDQIFLAAHLNDTHVHNSSTSNYPGMDIQHRKLSNHTYMDIHKRQKKLINNCWYSPSNKNDRKTTKSASVASFSNKTSISNGNLTWLSCQPLAFKISNVYMSVTCVGCKTSRTKIKFFYVKLWSRCLRWLLESSS